MLLAIESDASYLLVVKACSRATGYLFISLMLHPRHRPFKPNGAVHTLRHIMRKVLSSATEAELCALFHLGKEACPPLYVAALEEMGEPQPARSPMLATNNSNAAARGIATHTIKQRQSKGSFDLHFIGSAIAGARVNSISIGAKVRPKVSNTFRNITLLPPITRPFVPCTCTYEPHAELLWLPLNDVRPPPSTSANSTVEPDEGVMLSPGRLERHCDYVTGC